MNTYKITGIQRNGDLVEFLHEDFPNMVSSSGEMMYHSGSDAMSIRITNIKLLPVTPSK